MGFEAEQFEVFPDRLHLRREEPAKNMLAKHSP